MTVLDVQDLEDPRPTLADVARVAGVSPATASRVINGFPRVRPETRRQVEAAILDLGYVRQRAAKTNLRPRTGSVAVVVCEQAHRLFADPAFGRVLWGASQVLAPSGHQAVLLMAQSAKDAQSVLKYLRGGHVDGALLISINARYAVPLEQIPVPIVSAGRPRCAQDWSFVDADDRGGAQRAARHLLDHGRTRIATIAGPKDVPPAEARFAGFREVLAEEDRFEPGLVAYGDFGQRSGEHLTLRLLERRPDLDAIFAASDSMAIGALRALRRNGRRVPDEVAVIGFGNSPLARSTIPPLTTVKSPIEAIGAHAARELLATMAGNSGQPRHIVLDTELIVRESA